MAKYYTQEKNQAIQTLEWNETDIESLKLLLTRSAEPIVTLKDESGLEWSFTIRRRCRLYLMAKTHYMNQYVEVHVFK